MRTIKSLSRLYSLGVRTSSYAKRTVAFVVLRPVKARIGNLTGKLTDLMLDIRYRLDPTFRADIKTINASLDQVVRSAERINATLDGSLERHRERRESWETEDREREAQALEREAQFQARLSPSYTRALLEIRDPNRRRDPS